MPKVDGLRVLELACGTGIVTRRLREALPDSATVVATDLSEALAELFPDDPPRFLETPYGYRDSEQIRADMSAAGWEDVQLEDVCLQSVAPSAADFAAGFTLGTPLAHELAARGSDVDAVTRALAAALIPVGGDRPFELLLAATVIRAVR